jgi:L-rhamnose mutarotase
MTHVIVRHEVKDFDSWKEVFDSVENMRKSSGEKSFQIFRDEVNRNLVFGIFKWETPEKAREYFESSELKGKMEEAGVVGEPVFYFVDEA